MTDSNNPDAFTSGSLLELRRTLHRHPEPSGSERGTAAIIERFFTPLEPDRIIRQLGGEGIAFVFDGSKSGKTLMFRADLDALPIREEAVTEWSSANPGISHKCGHDGHMTILAGLGERISRDRPERGRVILLFQPEEETGSGAAKVLSDEQFDDLKPDHIFGLHNLPGFPRHTIVIRKGTFAAASKGMIIRLTGKTAHAGQPETGISPATAIGELIRFVNDEIPASGDEFSDFVLATVIHIRLGEQAFGTAPGEAVFMLTLRACQNNDMEKLTRMVEDKVRSAGAAHDLRISISYTEEFPATVNHDEEVGMLEKTARENGFLIRNLKESFRWSEDFGHYLEHFPGAFFGLGAGERTPQLHNPDYDFPDEITQTGIGIFYALYRLILKP